MQTHLDLALSPSDAADSARLTDHAARALGITPERITDLRVLRRSVDARRRHLIVNMRLQIVADEPAPSFEPVRFDYPDVSKRDPVLVVGAGPAGSSRRSA
jgi:hypothetical protein